MNEIISKYNFVYNNKLKALEKEFILRAPYTGQKRHE